MTDSKVLVITDSLGFPRAEPQHVSYDQTWIALLKQGCPQIDFIHHGRGGASLPELIAHSNYYVGTSEPDLVIMQSGIVDCAPRALRRIESMVVRKVPIIKHIIGPLVRRNAAWLRRVRKIQYCPPEAFRANAAKIQEMFPQVVWVGITPSNPDWEKLVPGITDAISEHNAVLAERDYLSLENLHADDIMTDHHHLTVSGHKKVYDRLLAHPTLMALIEKRDI